MSADFRIPHSVRRVAEISLDALVTNLGALGGENPAVDVRADAYGHGLEVVAPALLEAGARTFVVSPDVDVDATGSLGRLLASQGARAMTAATMAERGETFIGPELYGLTDRSLRPAMRFATEVLGLKAVQAGEGVSYGFTYRPGSDTTLALVGVGYAHGAVRRASNRVRIRIGRGLHPVAGAISMDQLSVDLEVAPTADPRDAAVRVGDEAVLFGDPAMGEPHVLDWAEATGIPAPAITSRVSSVVARVAMRGGREAARSAEPSVSTAALDLAQLSASAVPSRATPAAAGKARPRAESSRAAAVAAPASRAVARIDLDALRRNVATLAATVAPASTMLVVKSDAYGHDLFSCVHAGLDAGATSLGALEIGAGLALRDGGITVPLFAWMHGTRADFRRAIERDIDLGVSALWQLDAIAAAGSDADRGLARVHLKIDTGLRRSGANREDWPRLVSHALDLERRGLLQVVAAWSHLSDTSPDDDRRSLESFSSAVDEARSLGAEFELLHVGASAAGIDYAEARHSVVRFGIAAYGISPFHDRSAGDLGLAPVMSLETRVLHVADGRALISAGYGDGVQCPRDAQTLVRIGDRLARVVEVDVDTAVVDLSASGTEASPADAARGDTVVLFGGAGAPTAEEWAERCDTVGDELVTGVTARVPRVAHTG
ncbi:hypothetical protein GCM10011490_04660 [Pseudoclavibacter endophyticus]|uniref:alanine racemase n=1 Tax=Pseudoclavibacter endophyticus TaxID=1778590 RepID=UPI0016630D4D|nr:alanine racemase [Pseudoclavibacter endophyticus]GGA57860.1 hypothetical protein GCM10011490_04660 [Pseudoclavibacter endophyticus]